MTKQEETKVQLKTSELTLLQKVALEGEIAGEIYEAKSDTEKLIKAFTRLATCEEMFLLVYKQEYCKYFDPETVDELVRYRYLELVPVNLYAKKLIQDIKKISGSDCGSMMVKAMPVEIIKSKFALIVLELAKYIPSTMKALLDSMLRQLEGELDYLNPVILAISDSLLEEGVEKSVAYESKLKILSIAIETVPILSFTQEIENAKRAIKEEGMTPQQKVESRVKEIASAVGAALGANVDVKMVQTAYKVKKIDKNNGMVVFEKEFDSRKEASDYINNIAENYPELIKQYNFEVELITK